ncbi:hypothetical protein OXX80_006482 [Metschnikowia pulcherrima]
MSQSITEDIPIPSLSNADFLTQLGAYFETSQGNSPFHITHKRLVPKSSSTKDDLSSNVVVHPSQFAQNTDSYLVLVRAKIGADKKLSTAVAPEDLTEFWAKYSKMLKASIARNKR